MKLSQHFEFLRTLVRGDIETWEAREKPAGGIVLVHLLIAGPTATNKALMKELEQYRGPETDLRAIDDDTGLPYVVTGCAHGMVGLREWMAMTRAARPIARTDEATFLSGGGQPAQTGPGEFTSFFGPSPAGFPGVSKPKTAPPPTSPASTPDHNAKGEPGEFTRIFGGAPTGTNAPASAPPAQRPEVAGQPLRPGEFTSFFQSPRPADFSGSGSETPIAFGRQEGMFGTAPPDHRAKLAETGGTEQWLKALNLDRPSVVEPVIAPVSPAVPARPPGADENREPGEYTKIFGKTGGGFEPGPPDPPPIPQAFPAPAAAPAVPSPPSVQPTSEAASEYTRMISVPRPSIPSVPSVPPVQAGGPPAGVEPEKAAEPAQRRARPKSKQTPAPILAIILSLLLLAILIVLFFAIYR